MAGSPPPSSPPPGINSAMLASMHKHDSDHHSAGKIPSGGEEHPSAIGSGHEGLAGRFGDQEGPVAGAFHKSLGKWGGSIDELFSKVNQEAAFHKSMTQALEQNLAPAGLGHDYASGYKGLGDVSLDNFAGTPSGANLVVHASGITNPSRGGGGPVIMHA